MLAIFFGLLSAAAYGAGDFVAGVSARRVSFAVIALVTQAFAAVGALIAAVVAPGSSDASAWLWGGLGGIGSGVGTIALYRGLARGYMNVVAPISAAVAAVLPVGVGLASGERPSAWVLVGIAVLLPAIVLISMPGTRSDPTQPRVAEGAIDGVVAGLGFGLLFVALARASEDSGLWPTVANQLAAFLLAAVFCLVTIGRRGIAELRGIDTRPVYGAAAAGVLGTIAIVAYLLATRHGFLVVASILAALYPAVTVLLARLLLSERTSPVQAFGLTLAALGVALVAAG